MNLFTKIPRKLSVLSFSFMLWTDNVSWNDCIIFKQYNTKAQTDLRTVSVLKRNIKTAIIIVRSFYKGSVPKFVNSVQVQLKTAKYPTKLG